MKWSLQQLKKFNNEAYNFSYEPDLKHRALETHDVLDIKSLHVEGSIKEISFNRFEVLFTIKGVLVLEDAVTLEGIDYPIALECEEIWYANEFWRRYVLDRKEYFRFRRTRLD